MHSSFSCSFADRGDTSNALFLQPFMEKFWFAFLVINKSCWFFPYFFHSDWSILSSSFRKRRSSQPRINCFHTHSSNLANPRRETIPLLALCNEGLLFLFVSQSYQLLPHFVRFRAMFMPKLGQAQFTELLPQQIYTSLPIYCHCGCLSPPPVLLITKQGGETHYINFSITPYLGSYWKVHRAGLLILPKDCGQVFWW